MKALVEYDENKISEETVAVLDSSDVSATIERNLALFVEAVELSSDLEILGTAYPIGENGEPDITQNEVFVIRNYARAEGIEGAYIEVSIDEVAQKVINVDKASEFLNVLQNDRADIVLKGITRIVGYYSRVTSWNKSKVGELRDRAQGTYGLTGKKSRFQNERLSAIDAL